MTKYARIKILGYVIVVLLVLAIAGVVAFCGRDSLDKDYDEILYPITENVYTFADGTSVSSRPTGAGDGTAYLLPNGIILLETGGGPGPLDMELDGVGKLSDLSEEAQAAIRAYYDEQGLRYDLEAELERVYGEYIAANYGQDSVNWSTGTLMQYTIPTGGDYDTIFFTTYVSHPHTTRTVTETRNETRIEYTIEEHTTCFRKFDGSPITPDIEGVYTLSDGTRVDFWSTTFPFDSYNLPDGTTLLRLDVDAIDPTNITAGSLNLDDLNETAQAAIVAHYAEQGLLYDLETELEKAYAEYLACDATDTAYSPGTIGQSVVPSAESERVVYITTTVRLPVGGNMVEETMFDTAFDRETGEPIDLLDLFTVPESELADIILDLSTVPDATILAEMDAAFSVDYIGFGLDGLYIQYPAGTLPSSELAFGFSVYYPDLAGIIHPWALPQ